MEEIVVNKPFTDKTAIECDWSTICWQGNVPTRDDHKKTYYTSNSLTNNENYQQQATSSPIIDNNFTHNEQQGSLIGKHRGVTY